MRPWVLPAPFPVRVFDRWGATMTWRDTMDPNAFARVRKCLLAVTALLFVLPSAQAGGGGLPGGLLADCHSGPPEEMVECAVNDIVAAAEKYAAAIQKEVERAIACQDPQYYSSDMQLLGLGTFYAGQFPDSQVTVQECAGRHHCTIDWSWSGYYIHLEIVDGLVTGSSSGTYGSADFLGTGSCRVNPATGVAFAFAGEWRADGYLFFGAQAGYNCDAAGLECL